ncbi:GGDEF domain-containing protein [Planctobacterium marinum]|uniref:GGDEF domain-containing protein n=1 Tax=Planctobacterium marinum TaxID=1631968 RepID=UPI001E4913B1|nr:diguanylate cyclase [Planctobacterium marinum]MCC2606962.1 GGDEF domain-containing protein [Planctobacterium marinum]
MNFKLLKLHSKLIALVLLFISVTVVFAANIGDLKPAAEFEWTDTLGEGGITLMTLAWIFFTLISRPAGKVTVLLIVGLLFMHVSMLLDLLDEFFQYPDNHAWLTAYESIPAPIGMILMTVGLYHWHKEQLTVNEQLRRRERIYREHGLMDFITGLYSAEYMKHQIEQELNALNNGAAPFSLLLLDIDHFDAFNRRFGDARGDQFLREIAEFIMLELRATDLASRYAGDRFIIMLPQTSQSDATAIARQLEQALHKRNFNPLAEDNEFHCQVSICVSEARQATQADQLLGQLNSQMEALKLSKRAAQAA